MPAHVFAQLLESDILGADAVARFHAVIAREGVDLAAMLTSGAQLPIRWFREAYPGLDAEQAACLGYFAGKQARLTSYSLLSLPLVSASSVSEVLRLLAFLPLISNVISARFLECEDFVTVMLTVNSGDPVLDRIPVFYCAAALVHLLEILSGEAPALTIHVAWPAPAGLLGHREYVAGRMRFNAPMHFIQVPRKTLASVCRFSDPVAYCSAVAGLEAMSGSRATPKDMPGRVKQLIEGSTGLAQMEKVARSLNLSVSTLKRRLAEEGTGFSELMADTQRDRAMLMLADASMSLEVIADSLGYRDLANFSHAFKRWTGYAPGEFRRRLASS